MIDWFSGFLPCIHKPLNAGSIISVNPDGSIDWQTPKRIQAVGSFEQTFTVSSYGADGEGNASFLYVSGNPSKFLQGHNIFGSDDLVQLVFDTYLKLCQFLHIQPTNEDINSVKIGDYRITRIDINYSFELQNRADVLAWLRAAEFKSKTRHGRPSSKGGTVYWGKTSRRWSLKAYSKGEEINKHKLPVELSQTPLTTWADNKLRIELTLRGKELDELMMSRGHAWIREEKAREIFNLYMKRLEMSEQVRLSDENIMDLPMNLRSTYLLWVDGHDLRSNMSKATYFRHRKQLKELGINIDLARESTEKTNVVPLIKVLEAVPAEVPAWAYEMGLVHASNSIHQPQANVISLFA